MGLSLTSHKLSNDPTEANYRWIIPIFLAEINASKSLSIETMKLLWYSMQCDLNDDRATLTDDIVISASMKNERGSKISRRYHTSYRVYDTRTAERLKSTVIRLLFSQMSRSHLRFRDSLYNAQINRDQFPWLSAVGCDGSFSPSLFGCHCTVNHRKICQTYKKP